MEWNASGSGRGSSERDVSRQRQVRPGRQSARAALVGWSLVSLESSLVALQTWGRTGRPPPDQTGGRTPHAVQCGVEPAADAAEMLFFGVKLPRATVRAV